MPRGASVKTTYLILYHKKSNVILRYFIYVAIAN